MRPIPLFILWGFMYLCSSVDISSRSDSVESIFDALGRQKRKNWLEILAGSNRGTSSEEDKKSISGRKPYDVRPPMDRALHQQIRRENIATLMEKRFQEQRSRLEEANKKIENRPPLSDVGRHFLKSPHLYPERRKNTNIRPKVELGRLFKGSHLIQSSPSSKVLGGERPKNLRYAEEAKSGLRPSGLRPEAQPFFPQSSSPRKITQSQLKEFRVNTNQPITDSSMKKERHLLDSRLGSLDSLSFDPSIVVNFSLLETSLTGKGKIKDASELKTKTRHSDVLTIVSKTPTKENNKYAYKYPHDGHLEDRLIFKRGKSIELSSRFYSNASTIHEPMALYVKIDIPKSSRGDSKFHHEKTREPSREKAPSRVAEEELSEFGPYSKGNDPSAGIDPSEVNLPSIDLSQLSLPESVRDSLRNYLEPLLSSLKPLTKSIPGLPGLDYPILSLVPYTNFYCSNMPFPGYYADTEARCQTWHACDIDGRQATFLCPNGTVFNQALMVCDWWYNSNCLDAPFYYALNKRLFGGILRTKTTTPYNRITLDLIDTIFL